MEQEKSSLSYFLTPSGGILALIAFFLPWVKLTCSGQVHNINGFQMAKQDGVYWVVFAAAILILVAFFFLRNKWGLSKIKKLSIVSCLAGMGILLYKYFDFKSSMDSMQQLMGSSGNWQQSLQQGGTQDLQLAIQFGAYVCLFGFVLAGLGALFMKEEGASRPRVVMNRETSETTRKTGAAFSRNASHSSPANRPSETGECQFCVNGLPPGFISCPECGAQKPAVMR